MFSCRGWAEYVKRYFNEAGEKFPTNSDLLPDLKIPVSMPRDQLKNILCNYPAKHNTPKHRDPVLGQRQHLTHSAVFIDLNCKHPSTALQSASLVSNSIFNPLCQI